MSAGREESGPDEVSPGTPVQSVVDRRRVLTGGVLAGAAGVGAAVWSYADPDPNNLVQSDKLIPSAESVAGGDLRIDAHGDTQAGILRPSPPQSLVQVLVLDRVPGVTVAELLAGLSDVIVELTEAPLGFDEPNDLTVTVGLGLELMQELAPQAKWPAPLPTFLREDLGEARGGDLFLQLGATAPAVLGAAQGRLLAELQGRARLRWSQVGSRGVQDSLGVFRNAMGFPDGISQPRTAQKQDEGVWIAPPGQDGPDSGATWVVVRRLRVDGTAWEAMSLNAQEAAVGRDKPIGAPLSGGVRDDALNLWMKHPDGAWMVPAGAHGRRAHPVFVGRPLMLRRSFGFANAATETGVPDEGVLFVAYLKDPTTFVLTQQRLDELDDLMALTTCTGSGLFYIPQGFRPGRPLLEVSPGPQA